MNKDGLGAGHEEVEPHGGRRRLVLGVSEQQAQVKLDCASERINSQHGAGETAQQLRALAAPEEDPGAVPSTHMVAHNSL